jgi:hypothetical protein
VEQSTKYKEQSTTKNVLRGILIIVGLLIATAGGVIAFRALFLEPTSTVVITETEIKELPNYTRVVGGTLLFLIGAAVAFLAATRIKKKDQ